MRLKRERERLYRSRFGAYYDAEGCHRGIISRIGLLGLVEAIGQADGSDRRGKAVVPEARPYLVFEIERAQRDVVTEVNVDAATNGVHEGGRIRLAGIVLDLLNNEVADANLRLAIQRVALLMPVEPRAGLVRVLAQIVRRMHVHDVSVSLYAYARPDVVVGKDGDSANPMAAEIRFTHGCAAAYLNAAAVSGRGWQRLTVSD